MQREVEGDAVSHNWCKLGVVSLTIPRRRSSINSGKDGTSVEDVWRDGGCGDSR